MSRLRFRAMYILKLIGAASLLAGVTALVALTTSEASAQPGGTPTIQSDATAGPSGTISDTVTVTGTSVGSPTGNVTFYLCQTSTSGTLDPGTCDDVAGNHFGTFQLSPGADDTSTASSASTTPSAAGTWCFSVDYSGDSNYDPASDNTPSSGVDPNECLLVTTSPSAAYSVISSLSLQLGPSGSLSDYVTVQGKSQYGDPTGQVDFYVCQTGTSQTLSPSYCPPSGTPEDTETLTGGASPTASATSASFTPSGAGTWCFSAVYLGDTSYSGSSDNTTSDNLDDYECALVTPASSSTSSTISSASLTLGPSGSVTDSVTVQGNSAGGSPTGSVDFYVCQTGTTTQSATPSYCTPSGTPQSTESLVTGPGDTSGADSTSFTPTSPGTWCFSAAYGGDSNYTGSSDNTTSENLDSNECTLVAQASSSSSTTVSSANITVGPEGTVTDTVTVSGNSVGGSPTGSVDFYVCQTGTTTQSATPSYCTPSGTPESTKSLVAGADDTSSATSASFTPASAGTWCFSAAYGGDTNYTGSSDNTTSNNVDSNECTLVSQAPTTTTSSVSTSTFILGQSAPVTDSATVTGNSVGGQPQGTLDFYVCGPTTSNALCTSESAPEGSVTLGGAGSDTSTATSSPFSPTSAGVWCFAAVYVPQSGGDYGSSSDNVSGSVQSDECFSAPYGFTSGNSATAYVGYSLSPVFTVQTGETTGTPVPTLKKTGKLPGGVTFTTTAGSGTATLSGTPKAKTGKVYDLTFKATFGRGRSAVVATQAFTLTVLEAPEFKAVPATKTVKIGTPFSYTFDTTSFDNGAYPTMSESGTLPTDIYFMDNGNGTATLSGTASGPTGLYPVTVTASNGVQPGPVSVSMTLDVKT